MLPVSIFKIKVCCNSVISWDILFIIVLWKVNEVNMFCSIAEATPNNELLVTNLAYAVKEDALKEIFLKAVSVKIPQSNGKPRGWVKAHVVAASALLSSIENVERHQIAF